MTGEEQDFLNGTYDDTGAYKRDSSGGQTGAWSSVLSGLGSFVGGAYRGVTNANNAQKLAQQRQQSAQWLWIGVAVLGGVLLFIANRKK